MDPECELRQLDGEWVDVEAVDAAAGHLTAQELAVGDRLRTICVLPERLARLFRKDAVVAENASWLFRATPYLVFAALWTAVALVPTFTTAMSLGAAADLIALVALLGSARFFTALAGMDVGTSFGGIGSSREMMIASLAALSALPPTVALRAA